MYKPRWIQKLYANIFGYFWLPCPLCGEYFGGHEWGRWGYKAIMRNRNEGEGICENCIDKVKERNKEFWKNLPPEKVYIP